MSHTRRRPRCFVHVGPQLVEILDVITLQSQDEVNVACVVGFCWRFGSSGNGPIAAPVSWPGQAMQTGEQGPTHSFKLALTNAALHFVSLCCALDHFSTRMSSPRYRSFETARFNHSRCYRNPSSFTFIFSYHTPHQHIRIALSNR